MNMMKNLIVLSHYETRYAKIDCKNVISMRKYASLGLKKKSMQWSKSTINNVDMAICDMIG